MSGSTREVALPRASSSERRQRGLADGGAGLSRAAAAAAMTIERAADPAAATAVFRACLDRVLIPERVRTRPGAAVIMGTS